MKSDSDPSIVLQGLEVFGEWEHPTPKMEQLREQFSEGWHRWTNRLGERATLINIFWGSDEPQLHAALLPRIEWLCREVEQAKEVLHQAVAFGEVERRSSLFSMRGEPSLSVIRTQFAMNAGTRDPKALETRLTAEYVAKQRRRRKGGKVIV